MARVFKTAWFSKAAGKAHIRDEELCSAMRQLMRGHADDLGGGVYKKRLGKNLYRSIIVAKGGRYWVYAYLYAKKDRANIRQDELVDFRALADLYTRKSDSEIETELRFGTLTEICHGECAEIQE
ncbi:MAG TPA: type II toxin-antitoxin system RelE/ParE family toxin [Terracidiphilus sp.]|nr:type II toxin-antitoxin system RelE/ParE family toxin [Terracidiphilus sp.]